MEAALLQASESVVEYIGISSASRESILDALTQWADAVPISTTQVRILGISCLQQAALQRLLERCPGLTALEMPAAEEPTAEPLCLLEHCSSQLVAQRLSRPTGAWALQQLPVSLTHLCLSECGSLHPSSLMHLRGLTALTRLSIRGLRVPPSPLPSPHKYSAENSSAEMEGVALAVPSALAPGQAAASSAGCVHGTVVLNERSEASTGTTEASAAGATAVFAAEGEDSELLCCPVVSSMQYWSRLTRLQDVEMVGQAYDDPGDPWDGLLPAFLTSLRHITRLAFHPPALRDPATALGFLALAPSLARLEIGGCGAAPLQLHESAWRAMAAVPTLEQLLLGHCDANVGSALPVTAEPIGMSDLTAAANVGLAAAASLSGWSGLSGGGGGRVWGGWGGDGWPMVAGDGNGGCGWQTTNGNPSAPEHSPIPWRSRDTHAWQSEAGDSSDAFLGTGLSDLHPIHQWNWDTEGVATSVDVQASPTAARSYGAVGVGDTMTPSSPHVKDLDGWETGPRQPGAATAGLYPGAPWIGYNSSQPRRKISGTDKDDIRESSRVGDDVILVTDVSPLNELVALGGVADEELSSRSGARSDEEGAADAGPGVGARVACGGPPAEGISPCVQADGRPDAEEMAVSQRCGNAASCLEAALAAAAAAPEVDGALATASTWGTVDASALAEVAAAAAVTAAVTLAIDSEKDLCASLTTEIAVDSPSLPASSAEMLRSLTPTTGVNTPTDRTSAAVSVDHSVSFISSSSVPSSRSSYCLTMARCGVAPMSSARTASEGGYSWCSSCGNDDSVAAVAAVVAVAAVAATAAGLAANKDTERVRAPLMYTLCEACSGGSKSSSAMMRSSSESLGIVTEGVISVSNSGFGASGIGGGCVSAVSSVAGALEVPGPHETSTTASLFLDGSAGDSASGHVQRSPLPFSEPCAVGPDGVSGSGVSDVEGANGGRGVEAAEAEAAIVAAALTAAAAFRAMALEAGLAPSLSCEAADCPATCGAVSLLAPEAVSEACSVSNAAATATASGGSSQYSDDGSMALGAVSTAPLERFMGPETGGEWTHPALLCRDVCSDTTAIQTGEATTSLSRLSPMPSVPSPGYVPVRPCVGELPDVLEPGSSSAPKAAAYKELLPPPTSDEGSEADTAQAAPFTRAQASAVTDTASELAATVAVCSPESVSVNSAALKRVVSAAADLSRPHYNNTAGTGGGGTRIFSGGGGGGLPKRGGGGVGRERGGALDWAAANPFFSLRRLSLLWLRDKDLVRIAGCGQLQAQLLSLSLADCEELTEAGMKAIAKLRRLEHLSLRGLTRTFDAIVASWTCLTDLQALEVGLSPAAAAALAAASDYDASVVTSPTAVHTKMSAPMGHVGNERDAFGGCIMDGSGVIAAVDSSERVGWAESPPSPMADSGSRVDGGFIYGQWPPLEGGSAASLAALQVTLCGQRSTGQQPYPPCSDELDEAVAAVAAAGGFNSDADDPIDGGSTYAEAMYGSGSSRMSSDGRADFCSDYRLDQPFDAQVGDYFSGDSATAATSAAVGTFDTPSSWLPSREPEGAGSGGVGVGGCSTVSAATAAEATSEAPPCGCDEYQLETLEHRRDSPPHSRDTIPAFHYRQVDHPYCNIYSNDFDDVDGCFARQGSPWPASPECRAGGFSSVASANRAGWDVGIDSGTAVRWGLPMPVQDTERSRSDNGPMSSGEEERVHSTRDGVAAVVAAAAAVAATSVAVPEEACRLSDNGLQVLLQLLPKLKELYLHNLPHLTPATLEQVLSRPGLRTLSVDGCCLLTPEFCELLSISALDLTTAAGDDTWETGERERGAGLRLRLVPV